MIIKIIFIVFVFSILLIYQSMNQWINQIQLINKSGHSAFQYLPVTSIICLLERDFEVKYRNMLLSYLL